MNDAQIVPPRGKDHDFVYIPPTLDGTTLERGVSRSLGRDVALSRCMARNLCADQWGGVSNSGATVLRLSLGLASGESLDVVAKVLSPDALNLFKCDCRFDSRLAEIAWARWWGEQGTPYVARVYDTRADVGSRTFWIVQEYFPQVGWPDIAGDPKRLPADEQRLQQLFEVVCVTADWAPDNLGVRGGELVTFDWGTTRLAPMEEDMAVLLARLAPGWLALEDAAKREWIGRYLDLYAAETGHRIDAEAFVARLPWARFMVTLRYVVEHAHSLRWVPHQTRSREMIHLFIRLCNRYLADLPLR